MVNTFETSAIQDPTNWNPQPDTEKSLCIYHANCADGFGAAYAVWKAAKEKGTLDHWTFLPASYGDAPPDCTPYEFVVIVDFSYPAEELRAMAESTAGDILVIDHHKSALPHLKDVALEGIINIRVDMEQSGAMLTWTQFHPGIDPPTLLRYIQDRDLWRFEMENTREIHAALMSYPMDFSAWDELMLFHERFPSSLITEGAAILRAYNKALDGFLESSATRMTIQGHSVPCINLPPLYASDAGNKLAQGEPFAAVYWIAPGHWQFSLRSTPDGMDVSEIAQKYGGGGHRNAAGFKISAQTDLRLLWQDPGTKPEGKHDIYSK